MAQKCLIQILLQLTKQASLIPQKCLLSQLHPQTRFKINFLPFSSQSSKKLYHCQYKDKLFNMWCLAILVSNQDILQQIRLYPNRYQAKRNFNIFKHKVLLVSIRTRLILLLSRRLKMDKFYNLVLSHLMDLSRLFSQLYLRQAMACSSNNLNKRSFNMYKCLFLLKLSLNKSVNL